MMKLPLVVTAASIAALMATQAFASPTGEAMTYSGTIVLGGIVTGNGTDSGTGVCDESGTLTISTTTTLDVDNLPPTAVLGVTTVYNGSISGSTWTGNGTSVGTINTCSGNATVCTFITLGVQMPGTPAPFALDINTGGNWNSVTNQGPVVLNGSNNLTPTAAGGGGTVGDPNAIPTMPIYALGLTIVALFGAATRYLRVGSKRK